MPSRRALLAAAGAAGASLAGCVGGPDRYSPAASVSLPPRPEAATPVGRTETEFGDDCPHGLGRLTARAYQTPGRITVETACDLITGHNNCTTAWGNAAFDVTHDWRLDARPFGGLDGDAADVVPVDRSEAAFALAGDRSRSSRAWSVRFTPPRDSTRTLTFRSTFAVESSPERGDTLVRVPVTWRVSKSPLANRQYGESLTLDYREG
ncbi:hypothetical protein [Halorarius halobius]|uniref:hypothetical protein n=1 Tax=Halorarius halobius TaxID=2962671 RepID=UPI0020CB7486|nr:hypothetical protein [Halorarius halobius]